MADRTTEFYTDTIIPCEQCGTPTHGEYSSDTGPLCVACWPFTVGPDGLEIDTNDDIEQCDDCNRRARYAVAVPYRSITGGRGWTWTGLCARHLPLDSTPEGGDWPTIDRESGRYAPRAPRAPRQCDAWHARHHRCTLDAGHSGAHRTRRCDTLYPGTWRDDV